MRSYGKVAHAALAATVMAGLAIVGAPAAQARTVHWETVTGFHVADDESPGAPAGKWYYWAYDVDDGQLELVHDATEPDHHDGSLRLAIPATDDYVMVQRSDGTYSTKTGYDALPFAGFTGSYALRVASGPPIAYRIQVGCSKDDVVAATLTFVGPFPKGSGWHTIDVTQGGQAQWTSDQPIGSLRAHTTHTLAHYEKQCPNGQIDENGLGLTGASGVVSYVDSVVLDGVATNFQPPGKNLTGTRRADRLVGGPLKDDLTGRGGDDTLIGRGESDSLDGGRGADVLRGGVGPDVMAGGSGGDVLNGGPGRDAMYDDVGRDVVRGRSGDDRIHLGAGADDVNAGSGDDHILLTVDGRRDRINCGPGKDLVTYLHHRDRRDRLVACEHVHVRR